MNDGILLSSNALRGLSAALSQYRTLSLETLGEVRSVLQRCVHELQRRVDEAAQEVRSLRAVLENADLEDADYDEQQYQAAIEWHENCLHWLRRAEDARGEYLQVAIQMDLVASEQIPRAVLKLDQKQSKVDSYLSEKLYKDISTTISHTRISVTGNKQANLSRETIDEAPLPVGFQWVPIDKIHGVAELRGQLIYKKVNENDVRRIFGILQRKVLPFIAANPDANAETFLLADGYTDTGEIGQRQRAYEVFFGQDSIVLERIGTNGNYSITNGQHRINIAQELGWCAVPVKVIGN